MPRQSRIDAPGALQHIIVRGIERRKIFRDDHDRYDFIDRLGGILEETATACYAWALIPNHFHLLLRTGNASIATVMRRLLTGHATCFNRRHRRHGHLFQNRYKSILCQEGAYLLELVRYIHLNPLRAKLVDDMDALGRFPFSGHGVIMGKHTQPWQDIDKVLSYFGKRIGPARRSYRAFVTKGIPEGKRADLVGGGLIRSAGGWKALKALKRAKVHLKSDERILGDGDFVAQVLSQSQEALAQRYTLRAQGVDLDDVANYAARLAGMESEEIWQPGRYRQLVIARSLLCYWAVHELGEQMTVLAGRLGISSAAVSKAVRRGADIAREKGYRFNISKKAKRGDV
ncbi:MAG: transposase [Desulfobacterales bacterium]|jgi:REP element-mobilizing transposase RayT